MNSHLNEFVRQWSSTYQSDVVLTSKVTGRVHEGGVSIGKRNDFLTKNMVITLLTFLFVEALLPDEFKTIRHFYLVTQLVVLFFLHVDNEGEITMASTSHVLMAFVAFTIAYMELSPAT